MKVRKLIGSIIFAAGFFCLFGEAETANMQLIWTSGSIAVLYIGYLILKPVIDKEEC